MFSVLSCVSTTVLWNNAFVLCVLNEVGWKLCLLLEASSEVLNTAMLTLGCSRP